MATPAIPLKEFDQEMASTRRLLERVPSDKGPWKPHEKSMALGHLVQLIASMPGWITSTLREPHVDLAATGGYGFHPTDALLQDVRYECARKRAKRSGRSRAMTR